MTDATEQNTLPESDGAQAPTATPERVDESGRSEQSGRGKQDPGPGEQFEVRAGKRERLRGEGWDPYPVRLPITTTIAAVRERYGHLQAGEETQDVVGLAGRVVFLRNTGRLCFVTLADGAGTTLQAMLSAKALPAEGHTCLAAFKSDVDLGDHLFVHGRVISSRRGELSVMAEPVLHEGADGAGLGGAAGLGDDDVAVPAWRIASKALRPLPKVWTNQEGEEVSLSEDNRARRRELDLLIRPAARDMVRTRAAVVRSLRENFHRRDYLELETPMLQVVHGGAAARPFVTHMNAFDMDLYLRIATEIYLKRAVVGGVDRVFEINRNFRNEGADSTHSPEFTALEAYEAYGTYDTIGELTKDLVQRACRDALGTTAVTLADGTEYDLGGEAWDRLDLYASVSQAVGEEITVETPRERLEALAEAHGIGVAPFWVPGKIVEELFEELVGSKLWAPTFVCDFPEDTSPLTRPHRSKPGLTEKWDLYVRGMELATGYSELADPVIQRERLVAQSLEAANGDPEAMQLDEEFIQALEQGVPPCGGMGMGIDRLLTAMTGLGIRETITFPFIKPQGK